MTNPIDGRDARCCADGELLPTGTECVVCGRTSLRHKMREHPASVAYREAEAETIREALANAKLISSRCQESDLALQRDRALSLLDDLERQLTRIGGYMTPTDQAKLFEARALLVEQGRRNHEPIPRERSAADAGAEYRCTTDRTTDGQPTYARRSDVAPVRWTTWGSVRGQGVIYTSRSLAELDLKRDRRGAAAQGGGSDRDLYLVDHEGFVVSPEGDNVYPDGRGSGALKVG